MLLPLLPASSPLDRPRRRGEGKGATAGLLPYGQRRGGEGRAISLPPHPLCCATAGLCHHPPPRDPDVRAAIAESILEPLYTAGGEGGGEGYDDRHWVRDGVPPVREEERDLERRRRRRWPVGGWVDLERRRRSEEREAVGGWWFLMSLFFLVWR